MKKTLFVSALSLSASISFAADAPKPKYGPANRPIATELVFSNDYFRSAEHQAPDFWAMIGFYVPEKFGSPAAIATVLNAAKAKMPKTADDKLISEEELLKKVDVDHWKERASDKGYKKVKGVTLDQMGKIAEAAFHQYGFPKATVEVVHIEKNDEATQKQITELLTKNEASAQDFVIANFNQKSYTDDADTGHIAPIAAFDAAQKKVLVLDQDREYYAPYWVGLDAFVGGMATIDKDAKTSRGLIWIHLNPEAK